MQIPYTIVQFTQLQMSEVIQLTKADIFLPEYRGRLTEGVTYNPSNDTLIWIDIIAAEVHRVSLTDPNDRQHEFFAFPKDSGETIGAIGLTSDDDTVIVCAKYGVATGNFVNGNIEYFFKYPENQRLRSNDGTIDPWGHLWIGVMTDFASGDVLPEGTLFRINCHDLSVQTMLENTLISNGLAFSNGGKTFLWTDSLTFTIWQFDYDNITNTLSNKRPFYDTRDTFDGPSPEPDGLTLTKDAEVYTAVFSCSSVVHLDSKGKVFRRFALPALNPTCTTIGGKNLDELYITTAHKDLKDKNANIDAADKNNDLGGYLFKYKLESSQGQTKNIWGNK